MELEKRVSKIYKRRCLSSSDGFVSFSREQNTMLGGTKPEFGLNGWEGVWRVCRVPDANILVQSNNNQTNGLFLHVGVD